MAITKKNGRGRTSHKPSDAVLYDLYVTQDKSASQIAEQYGVAVSTVKNWLRNGNPPQNKRQAAL